MRKIFLAVAAMAMLATACTKDDSAVVGNESLVSFSVSSPELATRYGEGTTATNLEWAFYDENGEKLDAISSSISNFGGSYSLTVELVDGRDYTALFWASAPDAPYTVNWDDKKMVVGSTLTANNEGYDAFYKHLSINNTQKTYKVELTRPFAQINIATKDLEKAEAAGVNVKSTKVSVAGYNTLNFEDGSVEGETTFTYNWAPVIKDVKVMTDYDLISMNYVLVEQKELVKVTLQVSEEEVSETATYADAITREYTTVPVQRNYKTFIVGNLLTTTNEFNITTVPGFNDTTLPETAIEKLIMDIQTVGGEFTLPSDITLKEALVVRKDVVLDLAGHTITGPAEARDADNNRIHVIVNEGTLTIKNGTVESVATNGGSAIYNEGTLTIEGATIEGAPIADGGWPSYAVNNYGNLTINTATINSYHGAIATGGDGVAVINDATVDVGQDTETNQTSWALYVFDNGKLTVNDGTFKNTKNEYGQVYGGGYICAISSKETIINGGTFDKTEGDNNGSGIYYNCSNLTIKGGTFDTDDVTTHLATGYKAIEKDDKWVVVANDVNNVVEDKADLQNALAAAKNTNETNVVIDAAGANIGNLNYGLNTDLVPAGSTVTIRNANVEGKSYGNGVNGTVIFEDCTFNNSGAYSIHFDNGTGNVIFKNCDLYGWNSFGSTLASVAFEGCTLTGNGTYALIRSYVDLTLTDCVINTSNANHNDVYSEGVEAVNGATLTENNVTYIVSNPKELKAAIIKGSKIEFANDITVDEWIMYSEDYNISSGEIITIDEINVTIDGKGHTLTVNSIESAGNGDQLFQSASVLNISDLTIKYADGLKGGLSLDSGVIKNVHFVGGGAAAIFPHNGEIKVEGCIFDTNGDAIYFEHECDNLTVTGCTFNQKADKNVILLRGDVKFTDNIINSGRTVNVVSGSPVVTGNDFNDVRFKVYGAATATISNNTINNLEFNGTTYASTFTNNTLSAAAQAVLNGATKVN